jgi:hypothetical protein
MFKEK